MQEETTRKGENKIIICLIALIAVIIAALLFVRARMTSVDEESLSMEEKNTEKTISMVTENGLPTGISYEFATSSSGNGGKMSQNQVKKTVLPIPDLSRAIPGNVSAVTKAEMEQIISLLRKDQNNAILWSELGLYRKETGDYEGARLAWEFAYELQPENAVIVENLGVLYGYYLKNSLKSEEFFRAAIALEPKSIHLRLRLFEFYRDVLEDNGKARAAIESALKDNPNNQQLTALLEEISQ